MELQEKSLNASDYWSNRIDVSKKKQQFVSGNV